MSASDMPYVARKGIFDLITGYANNNDASSKNSKKMNAQEAAIAFLSDELEGLFSRYECLNSSPSDIAQKMCEEVIGQDEVIEKIVHVAYFNQLINLAEDLGYSDLPKRNNIILVGDTGMGKTCSINALANHFKMPLAKYSVDSITSAGYIGNKVEDVLIRLFEIANRDLWLAERGIIYLDEFDKKREQETSAGKDINGKAVQEEILKLLEPSQIDIVLPDRTKVPFKTDKLTIILGGAFVGLDDIRRKRLCKKTLGFASNNDELTDDEIRAKGYIPQDFIDFGYIPECIGRINIIAELRKLDKDDVLRIIYQGKNSPYIKQTRFIANFLNVDMYISKKFIENVADEVLEAGTGVRSLESRMINIFYPIRQDAFEHRGEDGMCEIYDDGSYMLLYDDMTYYGMVE